MTRRVTIGRMPDPLRAHGAWVYLLVSVLAGALTAVRAGFLPALLAGSAFAGVFLAASALAIPPARRAPRLVAGLVVAIGAPLLALRTGADPRFLAFAAIAVFPAGLAGWFAERDGFHSPAALAFGVLALVLAAPSAACAGGVPDSRSWLLLGLLAPYFLWRTVRLRRRLSDSRGWNRARLKQVGLREAGLTLLWTVLVVAAVHVV